MQGPEPLVHSLVGIHNAMPQSPRSTRERIIKAASHLFYTEGIGGVSVDAVAERARVTKRTLYYHFASKDDLVTAYLEGRDQPNLELMAGWFRDAEGDLADKVAVIFTHLALAARHPKWKGCAFLRTVAELAAMPGPGGEAWSAAQAELRELADAAVPERARFPTIGAGAARHSPIGRRIRRFADPSRRRLHRRCGPGSAGAGCGCPNRTPLLTCFLAQSGRHGSRRWMLDDSILEQFV